MILFVNNGAFSQRDIPFGESGQIETIEFVLPDRKTCGGIPYVVYQNAAGGTGVTMLDWREASDGLHLVWRAGQEATLVPGTLTVFLRINANKTMEEIYRSDITTFDVVGWIDLDGPQTKVKVPDTPQPMMMALAADDGIMPLLEDPDTEPPITVNERTITVPAELQTIAVQNDIRSEAVKIVIPRYYDGADLSQYSTILKCVSEGGRSDIDLTASMAVDGQNMTFDWVLKPPETSYSGRLQIQIRCVSGDEYKWETFWTAVTIAESLDADPVIPMDANWVDQALNQIAQYAAAAGNSATSANASAYRAEAAAWNAESTVSGIDSKVAAAQQAATNAAQIAASAQAASTNASQSATEAQAAQTAAENAQANAETAAGNAAQEAAGQAANAVRTELQGIANQAEAAKTGAEAARDAAEQYAQDAANAAGGGVTGFNGRTGAVMPQAGDYTVDMVTGASRKGTAFSVVLSASGWANDQQTVHNDLLVSDGYVYITEAAVESFTAFNEAGIRAGDVLVNGQVIFYASSVPTVDLTVKILRIEATEV